MVVFRLAGRIGRTIGGALGGEEREDFLGGKPEEESMLLPILDSAFDYSLIDMPPSVGLELTTIGQPQNNSVG